MEWAYSHGEVQISRYHQISIREELSEPTCHASPIRLNMNKPGVINTLDWKQIDPRPLVGDEIEVEVRAVGLSYRVCPNIVHNTH